jgi:hypothetical protein
MEIKKMQLNTKTNKAYTSCVGGCSASGGGCSASGGGCSESGGGCALKKPNVSP